MQINLGKCVPVIYKFAEIRALQKDEWVKAFTKKLFMRFVIENEMSTSSIGKFFFEMSMGGFI